MFAAAPFSVGPFAALLPAFRRYNDAAGQSLLAVRAAGAGGCYASGTGVASITVRAKGGGTLVIGSTGAAQLRVLAFSSASSIVGAVGAASMRTSAAAWAAEINFPSYQPEQGRLVRIGRRMYRWEPTLGKWRPAGPA